MLIGINQNMPPALLDCLMRMGHGDEIVIADANFPAASIANSTIKGEAIYLPSFNAPDTARLITEIMPLDAFSEACAYRMEIDGEPESLGGVHSETFAVINAAKPADAHTGSLERQAFYQRASRSFAVVSTSENRPFGCFILRKGVIF